ncbi:RNA polymerase sigma factor [Streptomyces sp. NPDC058864]
MNSAQPQRAADGHADPRAVLYRAQHERLFRYVTRRVRDENAVADICQNVWKAYFHRFDRWQPYDDLAAPLFVIAQRRIVDWYEEQNRAADLPGDEILTERLAQLTQQGADTWGPVDSRLDLGHALDRLTQRQREALCLRYVDGLDRTTVARLMGISVDGVKKLIATAVKELRKMPELDGYRQTVTARGEVRK